MKWVIDSSSLFSILEEAKQNSPKTFTKAIQGDIVIIKKVFDECYGLLMNKKKINNDVNFQLKAKEYLQNLQAFYHSYNPEESIGLSIPIKNLGEFLNEFIDWNSIQNEKYFTRKDKSDLEILFNYFQLVNKDNINYYGLISKDKKFIRKVYVSFANIELRIILKNYDLNTPYRCFFEQGNL